MKRLNKNFRESLLNKKIRPWYQLKQEANNVIKDEDLRRAVMRYCDRQVNWCWRMSYAGRRGYAIVERKTPIVQKPDELA